MPITRFHIHNQRGAGLITIVALILVLGVIGAVLVSLINTESFTAMGQEAGERAAGLAEGGIEFALQAGTFPNYSFPLFSTRPPDMSLGDGTFFVDPPTVLTAIATGASPITLSVDSTSGFADPAVTGNDVWVVVDSEIFGCTGITANSFTSCTRNPPSPDHGIDNGVYPVTTLNGATGVGCGTGLTITVNPYAKRDSVAGFLPSGVISIQNELMYYAGVTLGAGDSITAFTGVTRCYKGTGGPNHVDTTPVYQRVITSTGTVPTGVIGNAQRVIRVTVGP